MLQEIYYYCGKAKKVEHADVTREGMSLSGTTKPDEATLQALTGENGPLQSGILPGVDTSVADGEQALWGAMHKEAVRKTKPRKEKTDPAEQLAPKTTKEKLVSI